MYPDAVFFLGGDFNTLGIDWSSDCPYLPAAYYRESLILLSQNLLLQIVTEPRRKYF